MVRSAISVPAGFTRMNLVRFVLYTIVGSSIWNGVLIGAGWLLGHNWELVGDYVQYFQYLVIAAAACAVVWFIWRRWSGRENLPSGFAD